MAEKRKKESSPVLSALCFAALLAYAAFAGILSFQLINKGILNTTLSAVFSGVLALIALIGLILALNRRAAVKITASLILFAMAGAVLYANIFIQDIDRTLVSMIGDSSTISTPISVVTESGSGISSIVSLGGRTVGYSEECTPVQLDTVKKQLEGSASGLNYVECGPASQALQSVISGSCDALIVPDNILLILSDEINPGLNTSISRLETYIVTENYSETVPVKTYAEAAPDPAPVADPGSEPEPVSEPADSANSEAEAPETEEPAPAVTPEPEDVHNSMVVYISGNDNYGSIGIDGRSDVNIVAAINFDTHRVFLVNTPRDYYLPISVSDNGTSDKLTHCGIYGIQCSMDTLANAYGINIDHFFKVNFSGFINIINAIGGIDVYNDFGFVDYGGNAFSMGEIHLNGERALLFARNRHQVGINNRGNNHMKVIQAVVNKLIDNPEILLDYTKLLDSLNDSFMTDLTAEEIYAIVNGQLSDMRGWSFDNYSVTGEGSSTTKTYSIPGSEVYVVIPNWDSVAEAARLLTDCLMGN